ncbi:LOW QUALITY PROTEIN: hypothetical protein YC2023_090175 [Brassica napus]
MEAKQGNIIIDTSPAQSIDFQSYKPIISFIKSSQVQNLTSPFPNSLSRHSQLLNKESTTRTRFLVLLCSSVPSPYSPPISKEEAIREAKTCPTSCLVKPLTTSSSLPQSSRNSNSHGSVSRSRSSTTTTTTHIPLSRSSRFLSLATCPSREEAPPSSSFSSSGQTLLSSNLQSKLSAPTAPTTSPCLPLLRSADVVVFMAPERSQQEDVRISTEGFATKLMVMINPRWLFEEEKGDFIGSFDCVRDGVVSGERWNVLVEEEEGDRALKVVSQFKARPSMEEIELVLYNLMAMNSPVTKKIS